MNEQRGFAMADTLVALTLAAMMMTGLLSANQTGTNSVVTAERKLTAAYLVRSLAIAERPDASGAQTIAGVEYQWTIDDRPVRTIGSSSVSLVDRKVTVEWQGRSERRVLQVGTSRLIGSS